MSLGPSISVLALFDPQNDRTLKVLYRVALSARLGVGGPGFLKFRNDHCVRVMG